MLLDVVHTSKLEKSVDNDGNSKINNYIVSRKLGQGAFGKVKLASDIDGNEFVCCIINHRQ
jgi:serine/threonine protein kinase